MKKTYLVLLSFIMLMLVAPNSYASLQPSPRNDVSIGVDSTSSTIGISWDTDAVVSIYDANNKLLYSGTDKNYTVYGLQDGELYRYKLQIQTEMGPETYFVSTYTQKNAKAHILKNVSENLDAADLSSTTILSDKFVSLDWEDAPGVTEYRIYKNNKYLTSVRDSFFVDSNVEKHAINTYEIQFEVELSEDEKEEVRSFYEKSGKDIDNPLTRPFSIIKIVDTNVLEDNVSIMALVKSFNWTYKTFIPDEYVEDPWYNFANWGDGIKYFKGDNRGFSSTIDRYRTKSVTDVYFFNDNVYYDEGAVHYNYKYVSPTVAYDKDYNFVDSKTASDTYFYFVKNTLNYNYAYYTYYHKVGNPFAVPGAEIDYLMDVKLYSNGSYSFVGVHDRAPSHELYLKIDNGSTITLFQHPNEGFDYLGAPSALARSFSISN